MTQDELKALVGQAALQYLQPGEIIGVGTGSTVNRFIDALATMKKGVAGALGKERPLGQGAVGMERFVAALREIGYSGALNVEREVEGQQQRLADMRMGAALLKRLIG